VTGIRSFIAVELSDDLHSALDVLIRSLQTRRLNSVRWVLPANIHITLKFLGDVAPKQFESLQKVILETANACRPFNITCRDLGAFPNLNRPRVLWAGVQAPPELAVLAKAIDDHTRPLGFPGEDRPFSPHLTLGRVQPIADPAALRAITQVLQEIKPGVIGTTHIDHITLFKSDLRPSGPVYSVMNRFPLS